MLTLVRGRRAQLARLLAALAAQTAPDFELVIAYMQAEPPTLGPMATRHVKTVPVPGEPLPLAAARNAAARAATGDHLIFLDVDCIPAPTLVAAYRAGLAAYDACLLGTVRYLPETVAPDHGFDDLQRYALRHPARPVLGPAECRVETDPTRLWGLSFALPRARFMAAGGFDAGYTGYGGEETDFALRLAHRGTAFYWLGAAQAIHQWHPICRPPLDHFEAIVANARRFHARWGLWCLEYWLAAFTRLGLIDWSPEAAALVVRRRPHADEIDAARRAGQHLAF